LARFLALDWDHNQLHVVLANVSGGGVRVLRAAVWSDEAPVTAADAAAVGQRLKERLKEAKIPAAPVLACLGRERVIVKDIRYPAVPAHEEPAVVRFQALKELTGAAEDVVIDYTTVGEAPNGERRAMVLVAKRELVAAQQELCKAAGLKLAGITPRPFGIAACIDRLAGTTVLTPPPEPADGAVGVLAISEGWAEFCVSRGGTLLLARSLVPGPNLAAEVRRSLAVYAGQVAGQPVRAVYVTGGADNAGVRERLHNLLDLPIHVLDPFAGADQPDQPAPDKRGGFCALVGLLHLQAARTGLPVNFVVPKQPKPPADPNKRKLLLAFGAAAAVLVALGTLGYFEYSKLDRQVKIQSARNKDLDGLLALADEDDKRIKAIGAWVDQNVNDLDELYDLTDRFPDPDKDGVRLTQLSIDVTERQGKEKHTAKMSLKGVTGDDFKPVDRLVLRFVEDGYRPDPKHMSPLRGPDRQRGYTQEFAIPRVDLDKRKPEDYKRQLDDDEGGNTGKERQNDRRQGRGGRGRQPGQ
jgi:Tfp pilus assembly PilM family ATPase